MKFVFEKERMIALGPEGTPMGQVAFPRVRAGLVNISSMTIFPAFRGQGVEDAMMEALLSHLDQQGSKAALTCPLAQDYVAAHPQWKRILPGEISFTKY